MNGIYDFENYKVHYLDTEMLMEYKAKKHEKRMVVLAGIASTLLAALSILILYKAAVVNKEIFAVAFMIFAIYVIVGIIIVGTVVRKKGEYLWAQ